MCFENCTALTEIDNTYNTLLLDAGSFYNCNQLNKINFYNTALIDDARGIFQKCAFSRLELPTN
ncbi:hypothetical protein FACS1894166_09800 [Bacilli bacterium]|nr:hypothetical protein FACS1894166_09800 [Bacilli bacterium]